VFAPRTGPLLGVLFLLWLVAAGIVLAQHPTGALGTTAIVVLAITFGLWIFLAVFFRDPERIPGAEIVAPADGRVALVQAEGDRLRIAVFMNVSDVHVNRFPIDARVETVADTGRGHAPAYRPGAKGNVQRAYRLATAIGPVELVQITGIVARRLVSFVAPGDAHRKGDRLGMIVLGSRVDLLLPAEKVRPLVKLGDRVRAGRTPIAEVRG
jgi:phosphatidylserine decarboxylase